MYVLDFEGKPIHKKRPRAARRGNFVSVYSDQKKEVKLTKEEAKAQLGDIIPTDEPLFVFTLFDMYIPKSTSKKKQKEMMSGELLHVKKPDIDNLAKYYLDCLNALTWIDDSQIVSLDTYKKYGENPKTKMYIYQVSELTSEVFYNIAELKIKHLIKKEAIGDL